MLQRPDSRQFEGHFHDGYAIAGVYTDENGASCHVVFKARTAFATVADVGEDLFVTKTPLEVGRTGSCLICAV